MKNKSHSHFFQLALWPLVALVSLGQLQRLELSTTPSIAVYGHELFLVAYSILLSIFAGRERLLETAQKIKVKVFQHPVAYACIFFYITITFLQLLIMRDWSGLLYALRLCLYFYFGTALWLGKNIGVLKTRYTRLQVVAVSSFILVIGLLQWFFLPDTRFLATLGWDDHYARLISTFFDPGFTGMALLIGMLYTATFLPKKASSLSFIAQIVLMGGFLLGIGLTFSRATYIATLFAGLLLMKKVGKAVAGLLLLVTILMIMYIPKPFGEGVDLFRTASISARVTAVQQQLSGMSAKTLILGNGLFSYQNSLHYLLDAEGERVLPSHSRMPDNILLNLLLSFGLIGAVFFCYGYYLLTSSIMKKNSIDGTLLAAVFLHTQFHNTLLQPFILLMLIWGFATQRYSTDADDEQKIL